MTSYILQQTIIRLPLLGGDLEGGVGNLAVALLLGFLLDLMLGDPAWLPHPIVAMGRWISFWEHHLNRGNWRMTKGALLAVVSIVLTFFLAFLAIDFVRHYAGQVAEVCLSSILVFFCLAGKTLRQEVRMVFEACDKGVEEGRHQVARIVGRDTQQLTLQECRTAALETLAENLNDGVIAPLFWLAVAGVPGMLAYKMVNTLDSMLGYHSDRYLRFGCWAARIDDVAGYIPARLTALLLILVSGKPSLLPFVLRFGPQHASPNSGWPEAALAGILNCRFGGPHDYFGQLFVKPYIGTNERPLTTHDMQRSLRLTFLVEVLAVSLMLLFVCM